MPEAAAPPAPAQQEAFTPLPVQNDPSSGSAKPIPQIDVGKAAEGARSNKPAGSGMDDSMSDLDKMFADNEPKAEKPTSRPKEAPKEEKVDTTPADDQNAPEAKEEAKGEDYGEDANAKAGNGKPVSAPELRKAYENLKREVAELREKAKSKGPSEDDLKTYKEQFEAEHTRRTALEKELAQAAYERSPEFMEKHAAPFRNAYQKARDRISSFKVTDKDGNARQASPDDFDAIMQVGDDMEAAVLSRELFGDTVGPIVMMQREKVQELHQGMQAAIKSAEENFGKSQQEKKVQSEMQTAKLNKLWKTLNDGAAEKYPQLFRPVEGDEKGNELLQKGYELVDRVFMDAEQMNPEETIKLHSQVRNRAAAFGRLVHQNRQKDAKIAELEKALEQYKESEPKNGEGRIGKKPEAEQYGENALSRYVDR